MIKTVEVMVNELADIMEENTNEAGLCSVTGMRAVVSYFEGVDSSVRPAVFAGLKKELSIRGVSREC